MAKEIELFQQIPIRKLVWRLGVPAMFAQFLNVLYSLVDRFFVGRIAGSGELALAAIGVSAPAITAISAFAFMVGIGGASMMSMKLGEGDSDRAQEALNSGALLLVFFSIIVTISAIVFRKPLLFLLGCSEAMYPLAQEYFTICVTGTTAVLVGGGLNHYIMAQGMARQAMFTLSLGAIINIILDPILIFTFQMGIRGAALATVLGQAGTMMLVLRLLLAKDTPLRLRLGNYSLLTMKKIVAIGSMSFLITLLDNLIIIFLNMVLRKYSPAALGDQYLACAAVVQSFMTVASLPEQGICSGCGTIFSYFYGQRNYQKIHRAFYDLLLVCTVYIGILYVLAQGFPLFFTSLFLQDPGTINMAAAALRKYTLVLPGLAVQYAFVQGMTSIAKIKYAFPMSVFRKVIYIVCVFSLPVFLDVSGVFYAGAISDFIGASFTLALFWLIANPKLRRELV